MGYAGTYFSGLSRIRARVALTAVNRAFTSSGVFSTLLSIFTVGILNGAGAFRDSSACLWAWLRVCCVGLRRYCEHLHACPHLTAFVLCIRVSEHLPER